MPPPPKRRSLVMLAGGLAAVAPFCIDSYLPSFGDIAGGLGTTISRVGLSLSVYFLGICLGQLAYGPILDRFGRKVPLLWGMGTMVVASMGCALAPNIEFLIAWRFLQALSGCVGMVASRALVMDYFPQDANRIFSSLMLVMGIAPILAPSIGGWIGLHFGWRAILHFQTLFALALTLACGWILPMDRRTDQRFSLDPWTVAKGYGTLLRNRTFLAFSMGGNWGTAGMLAYIAGSPFVYMHLFGFSEARYAWIFGINSAAMILGSQLNIPLVKRVQPTSLLRNAMAIQFLLTLILVFGGGWMGLAPLPCMGLVALVLVTQGVVTPNASALSLQPFREQAGSASALSGAFMMALSALASASVATFHNGTIRPMVITMALCTMLGLAFLLVAPRPSLSRESVRG